MAKKETNNLDSSIGGGMDKKAELSEYGSNKVLIIAVAVVVLIIIFMYFRNQQQQRDLELRRIEKRVELLEEWELLHQQQNR
jgi:hypothetical protein